MRIVQVDAFADEPFAGNPAAVCVLAEDRPDDWMRKVAREMNLSETAFLRPRDGGFGLRWFTPAVEVDLCGHATLAAAHVLWEDGHLSAGEPARFHTRSGRLEARRADNDRIAMDFPALPATPAPAPAGLVDALGAEPELVARSRFDYLVLLDDEAAVRALVPDFGLLRSLETRGLIATAPASGGFDFVSRFFAPACGVDEDPVTGSAHCCLAPFWADRLGRTALTGRQVSDRGGTVGVEVRGDRVTLFGRAITVLRAELVAGAS